MGKSLRYFLSSDFLWKDENEIGNLVNVYRLVRAGSKNGVSLTYIASMTRIPELESDSIRIINELERRINILMKFDLVVYTPNGSISLTEKGESFSD